MKQQRRFTKEFEEEAVRLVQTSGRTQREIAGDLGIGLSTLVRWLGRSRDRRAADPAMAAANDVTAELKRLRRENEILRQERDILSRGSPQSAFTPWSGAARSTRILPRTSGCLPFSMGCSRPITWLYR
jgi:transposase